VQLVNHTPIPADLRVTYINRHTPNRRGFLTAKATFDLRGGRAELDRDSPIEILDEPRDHVSGYIPQDVTVMNRDPFEVSLLGAVEAAEGEELDEARVTMEIGAVKRELDVLGDRVWNDTTISEPAPFTTMPLTWERAFGGSGTIEIDDGAFLDAQHPANPLGRGFDLGKHARAYGEQLELPEGYPRYELVRRLPNLERPDARIRTPDDEPMPACWAPVPLECGVRMQPVLDRIDPSRAADDFGEPRARRELIRSSLRHAHPDWWIPRPARGDRIRVDGVTPDAIDVELPALRVLGDYVVGRRSGTRELIPQSIIIFANERRMTITYQARFLVAYVVQQERCLRLRTEEGWYGGDDG
jgi:hypothetical protein